MSSRSPTSCANARPSELEVAVLERELHPHEELAALGVGRVLVGGDDVRAGAGEEARDRGDDAVAVGAGDEQAAVHAQRGGYFGERRERVVDERVAPARRQQRVDVAARGVAGDRQEDEPVEPPAPAAAARA